MTYEELKIQLDLNDSIDVLKSIGKQTKDNKWFVVCDEGDCHLFGNNGNEIDISKIKILYEYLIPKDIKKIIVPDSVKEIGEYTFALCENLISINISDSVEHIGYSAFQICNGLTSIIIPNSVKHIENTAFAYCENLTSIVIPDSVEHIGDTAFAWCEKLTSIIIPDSVEYIGDDVFYACINLKSIIFKGKTIEQVKSMKNYPFGIHDKSIIKCIS